MTTREILKRLPGLSRDTLYYWERRGWISSSGSEGPPLSEREYSVGTIDFSQVAPPPSRQSTRSRRHYTEGEFKKIAKIWEYYQQGLRPEKAYERAVTDLAKGKGGRRS